MAFKFVTVPAGELAAANVAVFLVVKGPSKAESVLGDCVAQLIQRPGGCAPPPTSCQSRMFFIMYCVRGMLLHQRLRQARDLDQGIVRVAARIIRLHTVRR